jgi:hypothetical protein
MVIEWEGGKFNNIIAVTSAIRPIKDIMAIDLTTLHFCGVAQN